MRCYAKLVAVLVLPLLCLALIRTDCGSHYMLGARGLWVYRFGSPADVRRFEDDADLAYSADTNNLELYEIGRRFRQIRAELVAAGLPEEEAERLAMSVARGGEGVTNPVLQSRDDGDDDREFVAALEPVDGAYRVAP